jgi:hypothetical protein
LGASAEDARIWQFFGGSFFYAQYKLEKIDKNQQEIVIFLIFVNEIFSRL